MEQSMISQYYPGQQIVASDGARYTLTHFAELTWWAIRAGSGVALPQPVSVLYPSWGGDDDRSGTDLVPSWRVRAKRRSFRQRQILARGRSGA
jgi:hypothetical protein